MPTAAISVRKLAFDTCQRDDFERISPDFFGIVLYPARLRINLFMFFLGHGNDLPLSVEYNATGAGRSLVNGGYVGGHKTKFEKIRFGA